MFCCKGPPPVEDPKPLIVDLHKVLSDRMWKSFVSTLTFWQKFGLKKEKFEVEIPDNFFVFEQIGQTIIPRGRNIQISHEQNVASSHQNRNNNAVSSLADKKTQGPEVIKLETEFSNNTAEKQTYKFRFEKTRKTEVSVTFQKGFTVAGKANFSIGIPKVLGDGSLGMEMETRYEVTKSEGQRFEETMLMEATSDIAVGPNSCYTAHMQLEEKALLTDFTVVTRMSMPQNEARAYIKRKRDGERVFVYKISNLPDVFEATVPGAKAVEEDGKIQGNKIDFEVHGILKGSIACNHRILLDSDEDDAAKQAAHMLHFAPTSDGAGDNK